MGNPFKKIDRKVDSKEEKAYSEKSGEIASKRKELAKLKEEMASATDAKKEELGKNWKDRMDAFQDEIHEKEAELLKYDLWIEADLGNHVKEMMENEENIDMKNTIDKNFKTICLDHANDKKNKFYNEKYEKFMKTGKGSESIFKLQLMLVECHEQEAVLKGFTINDIKFGKLKKFYDGILGGRTLKAMWNVAFENYPNYPISDNANFTDPSYMRKFLNKVVSICGGEVSEIPETSHAQVDMHEDNEIQGISEGAFPNTQGKRLPRSTAVIAPIEQKKISNPEIEDTQEFLDSFFEAKIPSQDKDAVAEIEGALLGEESIPATKQEIRVANYAGKRSNVLHQYGGTLDPINPDSVSRGLAYPVLREDYPEERAARFIEIFHAAGADNFKKSFNREELKTKFFQTIRDYMVVMKKNKDGGNVLKGISARRHFLQRFRLKVFKKILADPEIAKFFEEEIDLSSTEASMGGGSIQLQKWKNYLSDEMEHTEGTGITIELVDLMNNKFEKLRPKMTLKEKKEAEKKNSNN